MKEIIGLGIAAIIFWWGIGFVVGSADAGLNQYGTGSCKKYESYAEYSNLGYLFGCELFKERFNQ